MKRKTIAKLPGKEKLIEETFVAKFRKINRPIQDVPSVETKSKDIPYIKRAPPSTSSDNGEVLKILKEIKKGQEEIKNFMSDVDYRLTAIEKTLKEEMPEKPDVQIQNKILRKLLGYAARQHQALSLITGDMEDDEYTELASKLPMSSEETVFFVEEKLKTKKSADAMMRLLIKLKSCKRSVDGVLRDMFADELLYLYNLDGRKDRKSLLKLRCVAIVMDIFPDKDKSSLLEEIRAFVALSHNRFKQKKHKLKESILRRR